MTSQSYEQWGLLSNMQLYSYRNPHLDPKTNSLTQLPNQPTNPNRIVDDESELGLFGAVDVGSDACWYVVELLVYRRGDTTWVCQRNTASLTPTTHPQL